MLGFLQEQGIAHRDIKPDNMAVGGVRHGDTLHVVLFDFSLARIPVDNIRGQVRSVFAFVASHNHFVLDRGGKVFTQSAPVIKLPPGATEDDHLTLLRLLNSSTACF